VRRLPVVQRHREALVLDVGARQLGRNVLQSIPSAADERFVRDRDDVPMSRGIASFEPVHACCRPAHRREQPVEIGNRSALTNATAPSSARRTRDSRFEQRGLDPDRREQGQSRQRAVDIQEQSTSGYR
jgi:hypothetical protein